MTTHCLNCNETTTGKFCSNCNQSTSTHRFSLIHVIQHDFIHGIFHFDKGFFYTIKELFSRPGHSIRAYVEGRRANHFNYFATIILLLTITYLIKKWTKIEIADLYDHNSVGGLFKVLKGYSKIAVFLHVPLIALFSYLIFKKSRQNYAENIVLNLYLLCGLLTISLILPVFMIFTENRDFLLILNNFLSLATFAYVAIFYYQYFSADGYNKFQLIMRVLAIAILYLLAKQLINVILNFIGITYFH